MLGFSIPKILLCLLLPGETPVQKFLSLLEVAHGHLTDSSIGFQRNSISCTLCDRELTVDGQMTGHRLRFCEIQVKGAEIIEDTTTSHVFCS